MGNTREVPSRAAGRWCKEGQGLYSQQSRLRMLGKESFCKEHAQFWVGTQRRDLQAWGFAAQSRSRSGVVFIVSRSEQEVRLSMSFPVPASRTQRVPPATSYPVLEPGDTTCLLSTREIIAAHPSPLDVQTSSCCHFTL